MHPIKKIGTVATTLFLLTPFAALAASDTGLQATAGAAYGSTAPLDLPVLIGDIIKGALGLVGVTFLVLMVYAGYMWMIARGDESAVEKAKDTITRAIIGIVIVIAAYAITSFVINAFVPSATSTTTTTSTGAAKGATCDVVSGPQCATGLYCTNGTCQ